VLKLSFVLACRLLSGGGSGGGLPSARAVGYGWAPEILSKDETAMCIEGEDVIKLFHFGWSLLETREAKLKGEGEVGSS